MTAPTEEQIAAQFQFAQLAGQYYVAGRFAALTHCLPVAGNLLHHSTEMFLKCALVRTTTLAGLKNLSHKLPDLWTKFRASCTDPTLTELDDAINELDHFEVLRYPDSIVRKGMALSFVINRQEFSALPSGPLPAYHLVLEDIDRVSKIIMRSSGLSASAFLPSHSEYANHYLQLHNAHMYT